MNLWPRFLAHPVQLANDRKVHKQPLSSVVACRMMECCRVDDASPESLAFLQAEWIPMLTDCTSASVALSQLVRGHPQGLLQ